MPLPPTVHTLKETVRHAVGGGVQRLPGRARDLPGLAVRTAVVGLGYALTVTDRVREQYARARRDGVGNTVGRLRREGMSALRPRNGTAAPDTASTVAEEPTPAEEPVPAAEEPAPSAEEPAPAGEPTVQVVPERAESTAPRRAPRKAELPVDDYEQLSMGSLRARLRTFTVSDLTLLRDYERAHANRQNIVTMFENRIAKLEREG